MSDRVKRIVIAVALGIIVTGVCALLDFEFARLSIE